MSTLQKDVLLKQASRLPPSRGGMHPPAGRSSSLTVGRGSSRDFTPLTYQGYFETFRDVSIPGTNDIFRVYLSGSKDTHTEAPLLLLLHGGGYSGLTWSLFAKSISEMCHCKIAAIDLRGHGCTTTDNEEDLSMETLCKDVGEVYKNLGLEKTRTILIGHSMGGALAVHCANKLKDVMTSIMGFVVIDVVEGTAMDALQSMKSILSRRPSSFPTLPGAIQWCVSSGMTRNCEAARISMPGQLKHKMTGKPATYYINEAAVDVTKDVVGPCSMEAGVINEEDEEEEDADPSSRNAMIIPLKTESRSADSLHSGYTWRIDLGKTEPYWKGWFDGLSELFLGAPVTAKLLLLAGVDRLDRDLTIGQMQGKFQLQVLNRCGHAVHEDLPDKVAETVAHFLIRHKLADGMEGFTDELWPGGSPMC